MSTRAGVRRVIRAAATHLPLGIGRLLRERDEARRECDQTRRQLVRLTAQLHAVRQARVKEREDTWHNAKRYAYAYRRLVAAMAGRRPKELGIASTTAPPLECSMADRARARELREQAMLLVGLQRGVPLEDAVAGVIRQRLRAGDHLTGRSLAQSLQAGPSTATAGQLGSALVATAMNVPALAWESLQQVPAQVWRRLAPEEFFRTAFKVDPTAAVAAVRRLIVERPADMPPDGWLSVVKVAFGARQEVLAAEVFDVVERLADKAPEAWAGTAVDRDWLRPWIDRVLTPAKAVAVPAGHVPLAVIDYKQPDRLKASRNIGDYVQTLACLGHLARHQHLRLHGPAELVHLVQELQRRVRPALRLDTPARDVTLVPIHRDASNYDSVPERTWVLAFGWYMQSIFGRPDFPLHPHLRPIFLSFHCNRQELLTEAAIDYLRRYAPIGCRDWTTVDLLLSAGVPAFFSGCLTTTTGTVFPEVPAGERLAADAPIAYVDVEAGGGEEVIQQERDEIRYTELVPNLRDAIELLEGYRRRYARVVTSRLHCYLPARAIGVDVQFQPKNHADVRFNGLLDLDDAGYAQMRDGLLTKLETVLGMILAGEDEEAVYATWREICAEEVASAQARRDAVPPLPDPSFDLAAACALVRSAQVTIDRSVNDREGPEVHVALALDGNLKDELEVVVEAMLANSARPLRLWILCRDHGEDDYRRFAALFPQVTVAWLPCDKIDYGPVPGMLKHITVSTMDRLLLPDLLPERDRIIYHDIDALPLGDVAELYDWDLAGRRLAARSAVATHVVSGFSNIWRAAKRLRENPAAAHDLIRRMHARHAYDFTAFNAGILVLDLERMRADDFCRTFVPFVERYGMNDQEVLNCYAGANRAVLPPQWNALPTQEVVVDPKIIHWAGPLKPWREEYVLYRDVWAHYAQRVQARRPAVQSA